MTSDLIEHLDAEGAAGARGAVKSLYRRSYVQRVASGDPFGAPEEFMRRFDSYVTNPAFSMVIAVRDGEWIGQAWGWPLMPQSRWWHGIQPEPEPGFTTENGHRTFALSEIMVDQAHTGRGIARRLHDRLLGDRREERATLLVNPTNERAHSTYLRWGWSPIATLRPNWPGASLLDVMIRQLRPS